MTLFEKSTLAYGVDFSFNIAVLKLNQETADSLLDGRKKIEVKIRWGHGINFDQKTEGVYKFR